ncbi:MAG TPA: hypothetical protein VN326_19255 [Casimicrobiaceae bacterium]|jgi:hypothetical protein|nr:hypothetical protein [Casimicrobiaceae bacterium]
MPEYLAPGVYLEESDAGVKPISGVSTSTIDLETARALVAAIEPIIERTQPGWTRFNGTDPGITLIELFAWVAEGLLFRSGGYSESRRKAVLSAVADVTAIAHACEIEREPLKRPSFFVGRILDAATLQSEQDYHIEKHRRHNRNLHGFGIVSGLEVRVDATAGADGDCIIVDPGYAIDRCGEEIAVSERVRLTLPADGDAAYVSLRHWDHPGAQVPSQGTVEAGDIEEACAIAVVRDVSPPALAIARLVRFDGHWSVDSAFVRTRAGSP